MCFGLYDGGRRYRIEFAEFGPPAGGQARGKALQPALDRYAARLEHYARRYPMNWFNFYPYWASPADLS
jgi:predicted LPLAT superfamily acyltransferase